MSSQRRQLLASCSRDAHRGVKPWRRGRKRGSVFPASLRARVTACVRLQTSLKARTAGHLPEYILRFQPPLIVHNVLPVPVFITLADSSAQVCGLRPGMTVQECRLW